MGRYQEKSTEVATKQNGKIAGTEEEGVGDLSAIPLYSTNYDKRRNVEHNTKREYVHHQKLYFFLCGHKI
jgi:hypothetical protein